MERKTFANIINVSDFIYDRNLKLNIKIINYDENFDDIVKENLDLYFIISNNGSLNFDKLDIIKKSIQNNHNGVIIILHNKFDENCNCDDNLDTYTNNIYTIDFYTLSLHRILYNYKGNYDLLSEKTKTDIIKLVKSTIGEMEYKKTKII